MSLSSVPAAAVINFHVTVSTRLKLIVQHCCLSCIRKQLTFASFISLSPRLNRCFAVHTIFGSLHEATPTECSVITTKDMNIHDGKIMADNNTLALSVYRCSGLIELLTSEEN